MNKLVLLFILFLALNTSAQKVEVSIAHGITLSKTEIKLYNHYQKETEMLDAFNFYKVGIRVATHLSKRIDFRTGIYLNDKGYRFTEKYYFDQSPYQSLQPYQSSHTYFLNYLDIPLLFSYRFTKHFSINGGASLSLLLNRKEIKSTNKFDTPLLGGITYTKNRISLDLLYSYGQLAYLTKYTEDQHGIRDNYEFFHRQFSVTMGYCINKKIDPCKNCKQKGF